MRKAIERYELLRVHIEGDPKGRIPACAQCLEADLHPRRVRARCGPGRELHTSVWEAIAVASTLISRVRTSARRPPRLVRGSRFDIAEHIKHFYDWEFSGPLAPRPRTPGRTTLPSRIDISLEQMGDLKTEVSKHGPKPEKPAAPAPKRSQ